MGVVYKAEDIKLKRTVALKFISPNRFEDPESQARFINEAQAVASLNHPNIGTIYEIETDKKGPFHKVSPFNDPLLCRFFTLEVFSLLLEKKLINKDLVQKILHWRHTGFNVHSKVRTETKEETERVGKYMIRPILSLKRLSLDKALGQVVYQYGKHSSETESMFSDVLSFLQIFF